MIRMICRDLIGDAHEENGIYVGKIVGIHDTVRFQADTRADLGIAFHGAVKDLVERYTIDGYKPPRSMPGTN